MESYVRRYVAEEISQNNRRHSGNNHQQYRFLPYASDYPNVKPVDLWPEYSEGKLENVASMKFVHTLRSESKDLLPEATVRTSSARGNSQSRRGVSGTRRPLWNRDTKHVEVQPDPLYQCLKENLQRRGFDRNYEEARQNTDALRKLELERLKKKMEERRLREQRDLVERSFFDHWNEALLEEKNRRDVITRGETSIRSKLEIEFRKTFTLVLELVEFNQRKRLFKLAMQQLDELKVAEREQFVERQSYERIVRQRETDLVIKQREAEAKRKREREFHFAYHSLISEEIRERDQVVQWGLQRLRKMEQDAVAERERLIRHEILESVVYEEVLERQVVVRYSDAARATLRDSEETSRRRLVSVLRSQDEIKKDALLAQQRLLQLEKHGKDQLSVIESETKQRQQLIQLCQELWNQTQREEQLLREYFHRKVIHDSVLQEEMLERQYIIRSHGTAMSALFEEEADNRRSILALLQQEESRRRAVAAAASRDALKQREEQIRLKQFIQENAGSIVKQESVSRVAIQSNSFESWNLMIQQHIFRIGTLRLFHTHKMSRASLEEMETVSRNTVVGSERQSYLNGKEKEALRIAKENTVREVDRLSALRAEVERRNKPFLGVTLAERMEPSAALIVDSLYIGGPSDLAGIKLGDIFVQVGQSVVNNFSEMRKAVGEYAKMGESVPVVVSRDGAEISTSILVMTADKEFADLRNIFFDVDKHQRILRESKSASPSRGSAPGSPGQ